MIRVLILLFLAGCITNEVIERHTMNCPEPEIIGKMETPADWGTLDRAKFVCQDRYHKCLVRFEVREPLTYRAICGVR